MITDLGLLKELNKVSSSGFKPLTGLPLVWNDDKSTLKVNQRDFSVAAWLFGLNSAPQFICILHDLIRAQKGEPVDLVHLVIMVLMGPAYLLLAYYAFEIQRKPQLMSTFFNEMAKFEAYHISTQPQSWKVTLRQRIWTKLALPTCKIVRVTTGKVTPPLVVVASLLMPGFPVNLINLYPPKFVLSGVRLLGEMSPIAGFLLEKAVTFAWNFIYIQMQAKYWGMVVVHLVAGCVGLSSAILTIERKLLHGQLDWLGFLVAHRQINILASILNKLVSSVLVFFLLLVLAMQIVSSFLLLRTDPGAHIPLTLFCALCLIQGVVGVNFVFGYCADVHHTSSKMLRRLRARAQEETGYQTKEHRRMVRSIAPVKVNFGGVNFIEKMTPVVFQQFATERLLDCLLVTMKTKK